MQVCGKNERTIDLCTHDSKFKNTLQRPSCTRLRRNVRTRVFTRRQGGDNDFDYIKRRCAVARSVFVWVACSAVVCSAVVCGVRVSVTCWSFDPTPTLIDLGGNGQYVGDHRRFLLQRGCCHYWPVLASRPWIRYPSRLQTRLHCLLHKALACLQSAQGTLPDY